MKIIRLVILLSSLMALAVLSGCSDGSSGTPGKARTSLKIVFSTTSSATTTFQNLGVAGMTLDVIPVNAASFQPARIDLYAASKSSDSKSYTITNLTDNETYLFRIQAYDASGNYLYGGQSSAVMQPAPAVNAITVDAWYFKGFASVVSQQYSFATSEGVTGTVTFASDGTGSGSASSGETLTLALAPAKSGLTVFIRSSTGGKASGSFDPGAGAGSGSGTGGGGATFTWNINTVSTTPPSTSNTQTLLQAGVNDTKHAGYSGPTGYTDIYAARYGKVESDNVTLLETYTYRDPTSKTWTTTAPSGMPATLFNHTEYFLTASGWTSATSGMANNTATLNSDGTVTITNKTDNSRVTLTAAATDVSGQTIGAMGSILAKWPLVTTAAFPSGSTRYTMSWNRLDDSYSLWPGGFVAPGITTLAQVPALQMSFDIDKESNVTDYGYYGMFVSGGTTVDIYQYSTTGGTAAVKIGSGTYAFTTVQGQQILEITIPGNLRTQYRLGGNPIFGTIGGAVYTGTHNLPGTDYSNNSVCWNSTAMQFMQNSFMAGY